MGRSCMHRSRGRLENNSLSDIETSHGKGGFSPSKVLIKLKTYFGNGYWNKHRGPQDFMKQPIFNNKYLTYHNESLNN